MIRAAYTVVAIPVLGVLLVLSIVGGVLALLLTLVLSAVQTVFMGVLQGVLWMAEQVIDGIPR